MHLSVSQMDWRWPYQAIAQGTSLMVSSLSFSQPPTV